MPFYFVLDRSDESIEQELKATYKLKARSPPRDTIASTFIGDSIAHCPHPGLSAMMRLRRWFQPGLTDEELTGRLEQ